MKLSIVIIIAAIVIGGIVAISGFMTNQEIKDIPELSEILCIVPPLFYVKINFLL